jgi:uncharacterized protein (TIGR02678 family)
VLDRNRHPELFALVRDPRHRPVLTEWFANRLGYRLVVGDRAARLYRLPVAGRTVAPSPYQPPPRRVLVLAILAAAAAEDAEEVTTTQDLSDRVRALTRHAEVGVEPYDPDRFAERRLFVQSLGLLAEAGPLRPLGRDTDERREGWAHRQDSVGGVYAVDRDLLLRLIDPAAMVAALDQASALNQGGAARAGAESATRFTVMRRLVELPVCLYADLDETELLYLRRQRQRLLAWCHEMTGCEVEQRQEGLALIAPDDTCTDLPFPRLRAVDFLALMLLDRLRDAADLGRRLTGDQLDTAVDQVRLEHSRALTKELESGTALRQQVLELLQALDLLRPGDPPGSWWLSPAAERFRHPTVQAVTSTLHGDLLTEDAAG